MSLATPPVTDTSTAADIQRLKKIHQEIVAQRKGANRSTTLTLIVGLVALGLLSVYFYVGYGWLKEVTEPKSLINMATPLVDDNLPKVRDSIEAEVKKSAPVWAESLSKQMIEGMPKMRTAAEEQILGQFEASIAEATKVTDEEFGKFIKENRPLLEQKFKELATSDKLAAGSLKEVEDALDKQMKDDLKLKAQELFSTAKNLNAILTRLLDRKKLTPEEQLERRAITLIRRIKLEEADPSVIGKKLPDSEPEFVLEKPVNPLGKKAPEKKPDAPAPVKKDADKKEADKKASEKK